MKALTVLNPWPWLIVRGIKCVENRPWRTHYRGELLIHAGVGRSWMDRAYEDPKVRPLLPDPAELVFGAIVGKVTLVDCVSIESCLGEPFAFGPWCWIVRDAVEFKKPIPYRGRQMLFEVPNSLIAA